MMLLYFTRHFSAILQFKKPYFEIFFSPHWQNIVNSESDHLKNLDKHLLLQLVKLVFWHCNPRKNVVNSEMKNAKFTHKFEGYFSMSFERKSIKMVRMAGNRGLGEV